MLQREEFKGFFEEKYNAYIHSCVQKDVRIHPHLFDHARHLLQIIKGGKYVRPYLCYLSYISSGGEEIEKILPLLYALELYHGFALIHDDIIDNAQTRHGVDCLHAIFGQDSALLLGDMCLMFAWESILHTKLSLRGKELFIQLAKETVTGELLEVVSRGKKNTEALLDTITELKTARYTCVYPILLGLSMTSKKQYTERYAALGLCLGVVFQRIDNIYDIFASKEQLGKKPGSDISEGTPTHMHLMIIAQATAHEINQLKSYQGKILSSVDIQNVRALYAKYHILEHEKNTLMKELDRAEGILNSIMLEGEFRHAWQNIIDTMRDRLTVIG